MSLRCSRPSAILRRTDNSVARVRACVCVGVRVCGCTYISTCPLPVDVLRKHQPPVRLNGPLLPFLASVDSEPRSSDCALCSPTLALDPGSVVCVCASRCVSVDAAQSICLLAVTCMHARPHAHDHVATSLLLPVLQHLTSEESEIESRWAPDSAIMARFFHKVITSAIFDQVQPCINGMQLLCASLVVGTACFFDDAKGLIDSSQRGWIYALPDTTSVSDDDLESDDESSDGLPDVGARIGSKGVHSRSVQARPLVRLHWFVPFLFSRRGSFPLRYRLLRDCHCQQSRPTQHRQHHAVLGWRMDVVNDRDAHRSPTKSTTAPRSPAHCSLSGAWPRSPQRLFPTCVAIMREN